MCIAIYNDVSGIIGLKKTWILVIFILIIGLATYQAYQLYAPKQFSTEVYILCAGSLTNVINQSAVEFMKLYPDVRVFFSPYGSLEAVQRLKSGAPSDLIAVSDWDVIDSGLYGVKMPESAENYTNWYVIFARNAMCIAVPKDNPAGLTADNWYEKIISANSSAFWGRAMPWADPCGYRTILLFKLAEDYYRSPGLAERLANHTEAYVALKEFDLMHLVALGQLPCAFTYVSLARQFANVGKGVDYIELPNQINLGNASYEETYNKAAVNFQNPTTGQWTAKKGTAIMYAFTIPNTARNKYWATMFARFLLLNSEILIKNYQIPVTPSIARGNIHAIPSELLSLCTY